METFDYLFDVRDEKRHSSLDTVEKWVIEEEGFLPNPDYSYRTKTERPRVFTNYDYYNFQPSQLIAVETINGKTVNLPKTYQAWADAINKSKYILTYIDVNEETEERTTYCPKTWARTVDLLVSVANLAAQGDKHLPAPAIFDGYEGSIDIHWETPQMRMLVNVPKSLSELISYYGEDSKGQSVKGKLSDRDDLKNNLLAILKSAY
ncbi:hypothetical protein [Fibrella aquatilis]|uniref:Uncharacterized protein n=1 Tax=Fibrella aquatilis TaxID=2817059 RepID=A0A939G6D8_9BACT|nr:hypothetical protein [Fibrella aquatilis]MBO0932716.1 hypothetical protein [Fibrella aquatilis]